MNIDERLRAALHRRAGGIEPGEGGWRQIQQRVDEADRRRRRRWAAGATGAVAAAVLLVVAVASFGGGQTVESGPAAPPPATASTEPPVPTSLAPPPTEESAHGFSGIWPFRTRAELSAYLGTGASHYDDPAEVARAFAVEYLAMVDPVVTAPSGLGPDGTFDVVVQPRGEGGRIIEPGVLETTVKLDPEGPAWNVLNATSPDIRLDGATFGRAATSPLTVSGESSTFEGTVQVEVRQDGMEAGEALGRGIVTGGAGPGLGPFSGQVSFDPASTDEGTLLLYTTSAADGSVQQATVVDVFFPAQHQTEVTVFFHRGEELVPVTRSVPVTAGVLRASLEELLAGPTEKEQADGLQSWFSTETAGLLDGVTVETGSAVVNLGDFRAIIPNASTSAGSEILLSQLNATVFQFPTVSSVEYRVDDNCDAFYEWLQRGCEVIERPGG
ncbi:MAG TPA: Gmad2 immunoglobulin-like domain-containing protein [Acidimicrobiales bacterium]|nr:Gmad2 immunoglobulin-like domain-containing protein [Acidimicrobiales bacterium]